MKQNLPIQLPNLQDKPLSMLKKLLMLGERDSLQTRAQFCLYINKEKSLMATQFILIT
jgi:hypothetical protein